MMEEVIGMVRQALGKTLLGVGALTFGLCLAVAGANATVKPGDVITPENAGQVKDLVSPGVFYTVTHGMRIDVVPTERVDWPPPYKDATEKYSAQVRLSEDHRSLVGFVAGQPFPLIDTNDPYVGSKIMWNNVFRPISTDDYDLRFFDCQIEYVNPDFKKTGRLWLFGLYPLLAPQEARGQGLLRFRYADAKRGDDSWSWNPGSRRVKRLNEALNSTATGAQSFDPDHYSGFNPKTEEYNYKFLGEKEMLAVVHAAHSPEITCPYDGGASACPENWEMRHMYTVEATPVRTMGAAGNVLDKETVVYMDSEVWYEPYVDGYDQKGQLWRTNVFWAAYRDRPVPDAKVAIYPFKREFIVGSARYDVQSGFATMCYLPGQNTPERECWYINRGAVDKNFFTTDAMVKAAP